jgi:hypothetical protein
MQVSAVVLPVNAPLKVATVTTASRSRPAAARDGFAGCLHSGQPDAPVAGVSPPSASLLMMQAEADLDRFPRRQRGGREAAVAAVDLLAELQKNALGISSALPDQALAAAAEELDGLADNAEPELARICRAVALRLKVEIAKRDGQQDASA